MSDFKEIVEKLQYGDPDEAEGALKEALGMRGSGSAEKRDPRDPGTAVGLKILRRYMLTERMARERFEGLEAETAEFESARREDEPDLPINDPTGHDLDDLVRDVLRFEANLKAIQKNPKPLLRKIAQDF